MGDAWLAAVQDANCFRASHDVNDADIDPDGMNIPKAECGALMKDHATSLCTALQTAALDWWLFDASDIDPANKATPWYGPGTVQLLRSIKETCANSTYQLGSLTFGWIMASNSPGHLHDALIFQNWTTYIDRTTHNHYASTTIRSSVFESTITGVQEPMVTFLDYFIGGRNRAPQSGAVPAEVVAGKHFFGNTGAPYGGECTSVLSLRSDRKLRRAF